MPAGVLDHYRPSLVTKLFSISIVLELARFLIIGNRADFTINITISRLFQVMVILAVVCEFLYSSRKLQSIKISREICGPYFILLVYILFIWVSYYCFLIFDRYSAHYPNFFTYMNNKKLILPNTRSFLELIIYVFYFVYFVLLPIYVLKDSTQIKYFFKFFFNSLIVLVAIGWIDFLLSLGNIELIARHLNDGVHVGQRWHSMYGEPRDAFAAIILSGCFLFFYHYFIQRVKNIKIIFFILILSLVFTQSLSGIIGIILTFGMLMILIVLYKLVTLKYFIIFFSVLAVLTATIFLSFQEFERLDFYYEAFNAISTLLLNSEPIFIEGTLSGQAPNIIPIWYRIFEIQSGIFYPSLFGTGLGSASTLNSYYMLEAGNMNPHTQITRILFEFGLIGSIIFLYSFIKPLSFFARKAIPSKLIRLEIFILFCFAAGTFLAHRSAVLYIFLGIILAYLINYKIIKNE